MRLGTVARYRSREVSFSADFQTQKDKWIELRIPFSSFNAEFRGRSLKDVGFDSSSVRRIGIFLGDKQPGAFQLEIDSISAYGATGSQNLVNLIAADERFKSLASAFSLSGLLDTLEGDGPFTVFAPTDAAFAKLPEQTIKGLLAEENRAELASILTYHVLLGSNKLSDVLKLEYLNTVRGDSVRVTFANGNVQVNDALLTDADIQASNGMIHVIDSVLIPLEIKPKSILSTAESAGSFKTLLAAVEAAGLRDLLDSNEPITVFAPTDEAFAALPNGTLEMLLNPDNRARLQSVLRNHTVKGRIGAGDALKAGSATTLGGGLLNFEIRQGMFQVNNVTIRTADLDCSNGVIHIVDVLILSPSATDLLSSDGVKKTIVVKEARDKIRLAIHRGVPLYNGGNVEGCAEIYENCIKSLASRAETEQALKSRLVLSLEIASAKSDHDRAWIFRKALDETLASLDHRPLP
jgi:uncharacterized surface protein with fasciclin (FAS1) repeats